MRIQIAHRERHAVRVAEPRVLGPTGLAWLGETRRGDGQEYPDEEEQHVAAGAAQPRQQVEQHREKSSDRQRRQREHEHRLGQFNEVERAILGALPLCDGAHREPDQHDQGEDGHVARPFRQQVASARHRRCDRQRFVHHVAADSTWHQAEDGRFEFRDTGIAGATDRRASVRVLRATPHANATPVKTAQRDRDGSVVFLFVLEGHLQVHGDAFGTHALQTDDACAIPADADYALDAAAPCEALEVLMNFASW